MQETLTKPTPTVSSAASFIGLKSYAEEDAAIFFGRDEESVKLHHLISANVLTIVFGKSGTGKTSLLNAGVFPRLREDNCLPFRIRLEFQENSPTLMSQIRAVLKAQIDKYGFKVEPLNATETLWEFFHRENLWKIVTPVLIFDQFEEIFTLAHKSPAKKKELDTLIDELADLIENTIPEKLRQDYLQANEQINFNYKKQKAKIIFAFREDFLPEMESITARIPSVKNSRFRLQPMNGTQANEVITKTWQEKINSAEAKKIVYYLTNETETESIDSEQRYGKFDLLEIEPSLLSQVCTYLEKERLHERLDKISADFLKRYPKGIILSSIYHQALKDSDIQVNNGDATVTNENQLQEFIEDNLVTQEGYRTRFATQEIPPAIEPAINALKRKYFIREEEKSIELTHDVIATIVKSDRDERRTRLAVKEARDKARKKAIRIIVIAALVALAGGFLLVKFAEIKRDKVLVQRDEAIAATDSVRMAKATLDNQLNQAKNEYNDWIKRHPYGAGAVPGALRDSVIDSLRSVMMADSLRRFQLMGQNFNLENALSRYRDSMDTYKRRIELDQPIINQFNSLKKENKDRKEYFRMYQSHLDSIIRFQTNPDTLRYHIKLIERYKDDFARLINN